MSASKNSVKHIALTVICAAVLAACGGGGGSGGNSLDTDLVGNATAARQVMNQIEALDAAADLEADDTAAVAAATQAYNALSSDQKALVSVANRTKLEEALEAVKANAAAAAAVTAAVNALPAAADIDTAAEEAQVAAAQNAYDALSDNQKTWVSSATESKLAAVSGGVMADNDSLTPLNLPTPLHTSFISSTTAQQHNPHMQLRVVDGQPALVDTQIGLIRSLVLNKNDQVVIDGAVLTNAASPGASGSGATEVQYLSPNSAITKASSAGTTQEDISAMVGEKRGVYSNVKTSLDEDIVATFNALEEARKVVADPESDLEQINEAKAEIAKLEPIYNTDMARRVRMEGQVNTVLDNLAYIKKDKNGLMFDKAFDGVYVIQFENGTQVVMHDPAAAGWTYQTFAHYTDPVNGILHGYQSLGDETTVAQMPASGTATYKGITTAYLDSKTATRQVTANVEAVADFAKKGVRFATSGSQIHTLNNNVRTSVAAANLDMKGTASWRAGENAFKGDVATADKAMSGTFNGKFYGGASVAEIGGTYGLKNQANTEQLIGGYGAKRQ
ncbi:MAG: transferrin-binding protein-like solute binding protein [Neisseria sp.]|nr:transferrin-binding protein-like solute binding protein [Neisseria sp.]